jgi:hypothetical protein
MGVAPARCDNQLHVRWHSVVEHYNLEHHGPIGLVVMATYRYYTASILGGGVVSEMPLYGVWMDKQIGRAGQFTGTFKLDTGQYVDKLLLDGTKPGLHAIYCVRDSTLIWGGPIWTRTYASEGKTMQISAQTWESVFDHVVFESHVIHQQVEQSAIFQSIINQMQAQPGNNFGFTMNTPFPTTGVKRTVLLPDYEFHMIMDAMRQLVDTDGGMEYTIDLLPSATPDVPEKRIRVGFPVLTGSSTNHFDYPGSITKYWFPESATQGGVKVAAIGIVPAGKQPKDVIRAVAIDGEKLDAGYPSWWKVNSYPLIGDQATIAARARDDLVTYGMPVITPTFELENVDSFTSWNSLGDSFSVTIQDPRFPTPHTATERLVGWELTPQASESDERLSFRIEGDDLA